MRALYREQTYIHGDYATVSLYPVYTPIRRRHGRSKPTSDVQQRLNDFNARERLGRQIDANFKPGDGFWTLTFRPEALPGTREDMIRVYQAYKRRMARYFKREGLGEMKTAAVIHGDAGTNAKRLHIHIVVDADIPAGDMEKLWGNGFVSVRPLVFGPLGARGIAEYMMAGMEWGRVMTTRNIIDPEPTERTGRISAAAVQELHDNWDNKQAYQGRWPGYEIADVRPFYNTFNRQYYLRVYLYKPRRDRKNGAQTV